MWRYISLAFPAVGGVIAHSFVGLRSPAPSKVAKYADLRRSTSPRPAPGTRRAKRPDQEQRIGVQEADSDAVAVRLISYRNRSCAKQSKRPSPPVAPRSGWLPLRDLWPPSPGPRFAGYLGERRIAR